VNEAHALYLPPCGAGQPDRRTVDRTPGGPATCM